MTVSPAARAAGAVILLREGSDPGGAAADDLLTAPFRSLAGGPRLVVDGPLSLAYAPARNRRVHIDDRVLCLVEGSIYDTGDLPRMAGSDGSTEELLARAWEHGGEQALVSLRGDMWALLWDRRARRGIVVCDQMGGRSPYLSRSQVGLLVASDLPDLLAALPSRPPPDRVAMVHWLAVSEPPDARSLFAGVLRLEAGHLLDIGGAVTEPRRYWAPRYRPPLQGTPAELASAIRSALERSVQRRTAGTEAAGVLLSGGLDSSMVAAVTARCGQGGAGPLRAYSAVFPDHPSIDESTFIDATTAHLGLHSSRIAVRGGSVLRGALPYLTAWRTPPTTPNLFFWAPLFERAAADGVDVLLDGEGGDEVFGCSPFLVSDRLRAGRLVSALRLARSMPGSPAGRARQNLRPALKAALPYSLHELLRGRRGRLRGAPPWMWPEPAEVYLATRAPNAWKRLAGPRWWAWMVRTISRGVGPALVYEQGRRRAAMAGLEARHPLVDVDLVELVLQLPPEMAFDPDLSRPLARASVAGLLPDTVRLRPSKSDFDAVFHEALAGTDLPEARRLLGAADAELGAYVDLTAIRRIFLDPDPPVEPRARQRWAILLWRMLTAECWLRSEADPEFLPGLAERGVTPVVDHAFQVAGPTTPAPSAG